MVDGNRRGNSSEKDAEHQTHRLVFAFDVDVEVKTGVLLRLDDRQIAAARQHDGGQRSDALSEELFFGIVRHVGTSVHERRRGLRHLVTPPKLPDFLPQLLQLGAGQLMRGRYG